MKIAVVTTSRADWNALGMVADALREDGGFDVHLAAVGQYDQAVIESEGWKPLYAPHARPAACQPAKAGYITQLMGVWFTVEKFDTVMLLGDRWETLAVAMAASMAGVPIAHLSGGDVTTGSLDDRYRHAITALSTYHFPTWHGALGKLIAMGIDGSHIWNVGSPAIDRIKQMSLLDKAQTFISLWVTMPRMVIVNWQPETASENPNAGLDAIFAVSANMEFQDAQHVFIDQNDDDGSAQARERIAAWVETHDNAIAVNNLPPQLYLSALTHCEFLIGNSSSGIYEAPALGTQVINVGTRQNGRPASPNVINSNSSVTSIIPAIDQIYRRRAMPRSYGDPARHPFGDGTASRQIVEVLKHLPL